MEVIREGMIVAGQWRVLAELETEQGSSFRVADDSGRDGELLVLQELGDLPERVESLSTLRHENIISIWDVGSWGSINYLVRELVTGQTIRDWLSREARLGFDQALGIACQLCLVSSELAKMGVDFLAYSPETIQVTINGFVKIDPLLLNRGSNDTHYHSPEEKGNRHTDQKSDLYRIGLLIHEMLLGRLPARIQDGSHTPDGIHQQYRDVPKELDDVLEVLLAREPADRYASADDLLDRLHPLLMHRPRYSTDDKPTKWNEDRRFWLYIALALGAAVIIIAFLLGYFS